jgi:16S rRNA (guanine(527)-N(7))-methyltransferase RsmG
VENILSAERVKFEAFAEFLRERNELMDLTSVPDSDTWRRHFADSLELLNIADFSAKRVIDIGSGAGFPGIPLKIACPDMSLTLVDAKEKRVEFMREAAERLGLRAETLHARAEELGHNPDYRERFDIAVSRAVARLSVLAELCLPFVKPGGLMLAHKGRDIDVELHEATGAITLLSGSLERVEQYAFGSIVVIRKLAAASERFPRRWKHIENTRL